MCDKRNIRYVKLNRKDHEHKVNEISNNCQYVPIIVDKNGKYIGGQKELTKLLKN